MVIEYEVSAAGANRRVKSYMSQQSGGVYLSEIALDCGIPEDTARMALNRLRDAGRVRDFSTEQLCGQPCYEWTG